LNSSFSWIVKERCVIEGLSVLCHQMCTVKSILFFPFVLLFVIIFSCKKSNSDPNTSPPIPPAPKDTLAPGWTKIVVSDTPLLYDIFFINNTGFAISESSIYRSVDGGNTWKNILSNGKGISNVGMGSETNGAFAISPQRLVATQDGGISFDTVTVSDASISDVFFVAPSIAYAVGNSFWKTIDAGLHWSKLHDFPNHGTGNYQTLYFLDEQTGWVIRYDSLYKTADGGLIWQAQNVRIPGVTTRLTLFFLRIQIMDSYLTGMLLLPLPTVV
jgi:hypothetical protein